MDKNGVHAAKGEVQLEGGISNHGTALFQTCMERPYNATSDEVLSYYQVGRGREVRKVRTMRSKKEEEEKYVPDVVQTHSCCFICYLQRALDNLFCSRPS